MLSLDQKRFCQQGALFCILLLLFVSVLVPPQLSENFTFKAGPRLLPWHYVWLPGLVGTAVVLAALGGGRLRASYWPLVLLQAVWAMGAFTGIDPLRSFQTSVAFFFKGTAVAWVVMETARNERRVRLLIHFIAGVICIMALVGLVEKLMGMPLFPSRYYTPDRIVGTIGHPLPMAALLVFGLPIALTSCYPYLFLMMIVGAIYVLASFATLSRSGIGLILMNLVLSLWTLVMNKRDLNLKRFPVFVAAALIASLTVIHLAASFSARAPRAVSQVLPRTGSHPAEAALSVRPTHVVVPTQTPYKRMELRAMVIDGSYLHRMSAYGTAFKVLRDYPVLGVGLGSYVLVFHQYRVWGSDSMIPSTDNMFLRLAAETGLLGLLAWAVLLVAWVRSALRTIRLTAPPLRLHQLAIFCGVTGLFVNSLFFDSFFWTSVLVPLSVAMALLVHPWGIDSSERLVLRFGKWRLSRI